MSDPSKFLLKGTPGTAKVVSTAVPTRAYGGSINPVTTSLAAGAAAAGAGIQSATDSLGVSDTASSATAAPVTQGGIALPSLQHLEAPLNAAISQWLQENQPTVHSLFKVTGMQPLQLVDGIVQFLHNRGAQPTPAMVNQAALDVIDSAEERMQIAAPDQLYRDGEDLSQRIVHSDMQQYSNARTAIATIRLAANVLPGGIRDLIKLRAALEIDKSIFDEAVQLSYNFHPGAYLGALIQNEAEFIRIR